MSPSASLIHQCTPNHYLRHRYLRQEGYVFASVRPFVCPCKRSGKSLQTIFMEARCVIDYWYEKTS